MPSTATILCNGLIVFYHYFFSNMIWYSSIDPFKYNKIFIFLCGAVNLVIFLMRSILLKSSKTRWKWWKIFRRMFFRNLTIILAISPIWGWKHGQLQTTIWRRSSLSCLSLGNEYIIFLLSCTLHFYCRVTFWIFWLESSPIIVDILLLCHLFWKYLSWWSLMPFAISFLIRLASVRYHVSHPSMITGITWQDTKINAVVITMHVILGYEVEVFLA